MVVCLQAVTRKIPAKSAQLKTRLDRRTPITTAPQQPETLPRRQAKNLTALHSKNQSKKLEVEVGIGPRATPRPRQRPAKELAPKTEEKGPPLRHEGVSRSLRRRQPRRPDGR